MLTAGLSHGAPDSRCSSPTRSVDGKKKRTFWRKNRPSHPRETPPNDHPNRSKSNETSFYVIQYKKNVLPVEAECIYYIKNLIVEEPNRYYGVNLDFEEDIQDINKVIAQEKDKFRIRNSPGMGWACLVKDQSGQLRRGIVFEFLAEEIAVYLVDTGDTITVPIGSTQIIPEGNKLLTLPPLAIRFAIKDLPDEYPMGRQEMVNLVEFCNKNHMHVKLLNVLEKERDPYGAFVVNLYVRSKNGTEDVAKLIKDGQFKPGNVASQASQPSGSCHIEVTADRPSGSVSRQQTESQRSQFERPQVSSDVRVSGLAQQQRQEALPESASASSETWILSPKHPTQRQDTLPQVQAVQKPARPPRKLQDVLPPAEPFQESNIPAGSHNADSESRSKVLGPKCDYCDSTGHALRFCKKREADLLEEKMQRSKELFAGVKPTTAARDDAYWKDFNGRFKFSRKWADSRRPRRPQATERPQSSVEDEDNWDVDPEDKEDKPSAVVEEPNAHETSKASSTASEPYEAQSVPSSLEMKHMTRNYVAKSDIRSATPCRYCDDPRHSFNYCKKRESDDIRSH
ncbi:hypothetical protein L596_026375 [Steinernema carpocapsae]|uniref:Tudor domain-containing protein n=1 Tax=Steinernema carpocapsae TaxID=34508 RepID=A0A4U5M1A1_STECR|nr:hypothetical protein L596_026375 [Steinernema carpocapsae]